MLVDLSQLDAGTWVIICFCEALCQNLCRLLLFAFPCCVDGCFFHFIWRGKFCRKLVHKHRERTLGREDRLNKGGPANQNVDTILQQHRASGDWFPPMGYVELIDFEPSMCQDNLLQRAAIQVGMVHACGGDMHDLYHSIPQRYILKAATRNYMTLSHFMCQDLKIENNQLRAVGCCLRKIHTAMMQP